MKLRLWPKRWWVRVLAVALAVVLVPYIWSRALSPARCLKVVNGSTSASSGEPAGSLRIACYNIAHGRGPVSSNYEGGSAGERLQRLDEIGDLLREIDADIVVLNEVDFDSSWSQGVNQAEYLARRAGYEHRVEQRNLDFRLLVWRWRFGNAILSKSPIENPQVIDFPGYRMWETVLAGKKRGVTCDIQSRGHRLRVVGAHLSHRSESLRVASSAMIENIARESPLPVFLAGDLNSSPPGFPHSLADGDGNNTIAKLDASGLFRRKPTSPPDMDGQTFHATDPRSVIDWILLPRDWKFENYQVEPSKLSDHRPVFADARAILEPRARDRR